MNSPPSQQPRFVGLDIHRRELTVAAVNSHQEVVLPPRRLHIDEFGGWARKNLGPNDSVVLEATGNAWHLYDQLQPLVGAVTVVHPYLVKLITAARVKTDARDALKLARLLAAGLAPPVWVPPQEVRELRGVLVHRGRLINQRTQARNRLHAVLQRHNLLPPEGGLFRASSRAWWEGLDLSSTEKLRVRQELTILQALEPLIEEAEAEIVRLSMVEPWASQVPFLVQLPGIAVLTAMTLLSAIGDITRFDSAKKLVGYSGLGASVHASGQEHRDGRITKQGRKEIRWACVEAAWRAVDSSEHWQERFERLNVRIGKKKAIVAIARKLLVVVWHVLSKHEVDRHAEEERVALKLISWSRGLCQKGRQGRTVAAFAREQLTVLGVGESLASVTLGSRVYRLLPSPAANDLKPARSPA